MHKSKKEKESHPMPDAMEAAERRLKEKHKDKNDNTSTNEEVAALQAKVSELEGLRDQMLRKAADFENAKRRLDREKESFSNYAFEQVLSKFLPILDNFDRALEHFSNSEAPQSEIEGIQLIHKQMTDLLVEFQVKPMEALGQPFDPNFHEAIGQIGSDQPEGIIVNELRKGYFFKDKVLRPASVQVSSGSLSPQEGQE